MGKKVGLGMTPSMTRAVPLNLVTFGKDSSHDLVS